eukprot:14570009-Heterocapsa_arctica.AAC.1
MAGLAAVSRPAACESVDSVFPLPLLPVRRLPGVSSAAGLAEAVRCWVNMILAALNILYAGGEEGTCWSPPSAAHRRIHAPLCTTVAGFLGEVSVWPSLPKLTTFSARAR